MMAKNNELHYRVTVMKKTIKILFFLICSSSFVLLPFSAGFADDDNHHDEKKWYKKIFDDDNEEKHGNEYLPPVNNEIFKQECGACHFAYQPGLLPSGSWEGILNALPSHFGEEVSLGQKEVKIIGEYLQTNAAENSSAKRSRKIMRSLNGNTPLRITEIPYIKEKHHELNASIFSRQSIGSFSNCIACHTKAGQGNYDDDYVKIPK
jgi:mono/diheme cytochrome c family protein